MKNICEFSGEKKVRGMDHQQKNDKTERARGLGRKTRQEIGKRNQITALRFQTGHARVVFYPFRPTTESSLGAPFKGSVRPTTVSSLGAPFKGSVRPTTESSLGALFKGSFRPLRFG